MKIPNACMGFALGSLATFDVVSAQVDHGLTRWLDIGAAIVFIIWTLELAKKERK